MSRPQLTHETPLRKRRLALLDALIERGPERFNMGTWYGTLDGDDVDFDARSAEVVYKDCETTCCLAGTGNLLLPAPKSVGGGHSLAHADSSSEMAEAVAEFFGLEEGCFYVSGWKYMDDERLHRRHEALLKIYNSLSSPDHEAVEFFAVTQWLAQIVEEGS